MSFSTAPPIKKNALTHNLWAWAPIPGLARKKSVSLGLRKELFDQILGQQP